MMCTWANGIHLGACRDRFIFGSCCKMPNDMDDMEAVVAEDETWEESVNGLPLDEICGKRHEEGSDPHGRIQGGVIANRTSWPWQG